MVVKFKCFKQFEWTVSASTLHCWLDDRKGIRPVKHWVLACWWWRFESFDSSFAHLVFPVVTTTSSLASIKSANPSSPGKMVVKMESFSEPLLLNLTGYLTCVVWYICNFWFRLIQVNLEEWVLNKFVNCFVCTFPSSGIHTEVSERVSE